MVNLKEIELLYNSIPNPCIILKPDAPSYTIAAVNKAFLDATFPENKALIGMAFFEAFQSNHDDDESRVSTLTAALDQVASEKLPRIIVQHRNVLSTDAEGFSEARYWNTEVYPLLDEAGEVHYLVQSSTDVTALVEAERKLEYNNRQLLQELKDRELVESALQLSNERYTYVNKVTNDAIYDWNIDTDRIEWGNAFYTSYGHPQVERFKILDWTRLVHPDDCPWLSRSLYDTLQKSGNNKWVKEYRIRRMDGTYADVEDNGYILRDEQGFARRMIGLLRDVSARKASEAELDSIKETFRELFLLNPLPMWVYDFDTLMFLDVNEAAVTHYGYTKEEFLAMTIVDIRPEEEAERFISTIKKKVQPGISHSQRVRHRKKSGEIILVNIRGNSIKYSNHKARMVVAIDITQKAKYEKALLDSERRFKTLIQESTDLIAILDSEGVYKYISPTVERLMHVKAEQILGKNAFSRIHASDREQLVRKLEALSPRESIKLDPYRLTDQHGRTHWVETIMTDMRADAAIDGIVCNARIVTERVEQEMKIKEHLERFNAVSKATSDAIWDLDFVKDKVLWNHGIQVVFGYQELEVNFQWWYDRVHPEDVDRVTGIVQHHVKNKLKRWNSEYRFRCADGEYKYVLDRGFLIFDDQSGEVVRMIGAIQDISALVAHTKAIEEHNSRLKDIAWAQAHLVRGPLTSILGLVPLLHDSIADHDTRASILSYLDRAAKQLDQVITEIINKSHEALKDYVEPD